MQPRTGTGEMLRILETPYLVFLFNCFRLITIGKERAVRGQQSARQQTVYLLSRAREGRRPTAVGGAGTLQVVCNLIFTQIREKAHTMPE